MVRAVTPIPFVKARFFDRCGKPLASGQIYTYEANTTTAKTTYKDPYGLTPNTNPIILDAAGEADIYLDGTYRIRITDRNDVLINDVAKIGSWFSDNLQDSLDNVSSAMGEALKPTLQNLNETISIAAAAGAGANGWTADLVLDPTLSLTQAQINAQLKALNIDYDKTVTVGASGADFTTINAALTELSKYKKVYVADNATSNTRAKILLKSGFVAAEQININGQDFGWIDIVSEDAEVVISRQALTQKIGRWYPFIRCKNGVTPSIKTLFSMDETGTATERVALYMIRSNGFIEPGAGFKNSGERNIDLTQTSSLVAAGGIFTGAKALSIRPATGSVIFLQYADLSDSARGLSAGSGATVAGEEMIANNCSVTAIEVQGGCTVDVSNASFKNSGTFGLYASRNCVINAAGADFSGGQGHGVYADCGASVDLTNAKVNNCQGTAGIRAINGAKISGRSITATGNKVNLYATKGGQIFTDIATLIGATTTGLFASESGIIAATNSQYRKTTGTDSTSDAQVLSGGTMYLNGSTGGASQKTDVQLPTGIIYKGVKTKAKGQAAIAVSSTYVDVTHTLSEIPIILATPISALGTATKWWVSNVTATTFRINIDATTTGTVTFHWSAELI